MKFNLLILIFIYLINCSISELSKCGVRKFDREQDTGEYEAKFGEFPWTVALIDNREDKGNIIRCGGSLIHPDIVLTAASCLQPFNNRIDRIKVESGIWRRDLSYPGYPIQERKVSQVYIHPSNRSIVAAREYYNFALLHLDNPIVLNDYTNTICLPSSGYETDSQDCVVTGWGNGDKEQSQIIMKRLPVPIVPFSDCQIALESRSGDQDGNGRVPKKLEEKYVCSGGKGVGAVQGDGGGPLVCPIGSPNDNRYIQIGVIAFSIGDFDGNVPEFNAKVATARNWIDKIFDKLELEKTYDIISN